MSKFNLPDTKKKLLIEAEAASNFFEAHRKITIYCSGNKINESELEEACASLTDYALSSGDRLALSLFIKAYTDFLDINKSPPMPMLKGLGEVLEKYRQKNISMNDAFNISKNNKGNPGLSLVKREWAVTNASMVRYWRECGETLEVAVEKTAAFRKSDSETTIKRHYFKYRELWE